MIVIFLFIIIPVPFARSALRSFEKNFVSNGRLLKSKPCAKKKSYECLTYFLPKRQIQYTYTADIACTESQPVTASLNKWDRLWFNAGKKICLCRHVQHRHTL